MPIPQDYKDIVDHAHDEIQGVRSVYMWLASILGLILIGGMWFTYQSASDFRNEMRNNIKEHKEDIKSLKQEVEARGDRELGTEAIQTIINERVTTRVDSVAEGIITKQIENQISPIIIEAENKLAIIDEEIRKIKLRNHMTELADKVISDASRFAYDELNKIADEYKKDSQEYFAAAAEVTRVRVTWHNLHRIINDSGTESYDDSGIDYYKLTTKQLIDYLLSDKRWQVRRESAKLLYNSRDADVAIALVKILKEDPDIEVVKEALRSFRNISSMPDRSILSYDRAIEWWDDNKENVIKKLKKK
jgi:hypothetical protein